MAKLPIGDRLSREDFQDVPKDLEPVLEKLIFQLNNFMTSVYDAMNGNLTAPENIAATYKTFKIRGGTTAASNTISFLHGLKYRPKGCYVIAAKRSDGTTIVSPVYVTWAISTKTDTINILAISMLSAGVDYELTVKIE